jgi:arabinosaccharide transport system substrate-binding protein
MIKRFFILILACLALFGVSATVSAQTEVTLSAWTHDALYIEFFNSRLAEWEAMHPDIKFTYDFQIIPNAWDRYLEALAAGETLPDLLGLEQGGFPKFMKDGIIEKYFVDLSDLVADNRADYAEGRMSIYSYNGKLYGLESSLTASVYYYQPKIFEDNGVEVPKTWEEMLAAGEVLGKKGIALNVATDDGNWFQMWFNQRGGAVFDKDSKFVFGDETNRAMAIEVADFIQKGVKNGTLMVVLGGDHWGGVTIPTAYREGRLAGQVMPDWWSSCCLMPGVEEMAGQWKVALPPVWSGGGAKTLVWGGTGWAVSQSEHSDLAKDFIAFMYLGQESQVQKFEKINMFPWMLSAYNDPRITTLEDPFYGGQKLGEIYAQLADGVPVWYQSPFRSDWGTAVHDNLPLLFDGTLTPEAFVDAVTTKTQEAIDFGF